MPPGTAGCPGPVGCHSWRLLPAFLRPSIHLMRQSINSSTHLFCLPCSAVRGLSNYMFHEAQRLAKEEVQKGQDKFDG